jgi:hypothetical protein
VIRAAAIAVAISAACMIPGIVRAVSLRTPRGEDRYGAAREALRGQGAASAGYLTDADLSIGRGQDVWRFYTAAYALAPVLLRPGTSERFLLVDLPDPAMLAPLLRSPSLELTRDLGDGVAIVERVKP